jgi:polysaccharide export outer membrane protein
MKRSETLQGNRRIRMSEEHFLLSCLRFLILILFCVAFLGCAAARSPSMVVGESGAILDGSNSLQEKPEPAMDELGTSGFMEENSDSDLSRQIEITGESVSIFSAPNTSASIIAKGKKGDVFKMVTEVGAWYKITVFPEERGYVFKDPDKIRISDVASVFNKEESVRYIEISEDDVNVLMAPSKSSTVFAKCQKGDVFKVITEIKEWYKVSMFSGEKGFVIKSLAKDVTKEVTSAFEEEVNATSPQKSDYVLNTGDVLDVKFFYNPGINEKVTIRPDGKISLQLVDEVEAVGLTPSQLDHLLTLKYSKRLNPLEVSVIVREFAGREVYVGGEVVSPGSMHLTTKMTSLQAILNAGGFRETAHPGSVLVISRAPGNNMLTRIIDLKEVLTEESDQKKDFLLKPFDIVYVPKTFIARADKFVDQWIRKLIPVNLNAGFSYARYKGEQTGDIKTISVLP